MLRGDDKIEGNTKTKGDVLSVLAKLDKTTQEGVHGGLYDVVVQQAQYSPVLEHNIGCILDLADRVVHRKAPILRKRQITRCENVECRVYVFDPYRI